MMNLEIPTGLWNVVALLEEFGDVSIEGSVGTTVKYSSCDYDEMPEGKVWFDGKLTFKLTRDNGSSWKDVVEKVKDTIVKGELIPYFLADLFPDCVISPDEGTYERTIWNGEFPVGDTTSIYLEFFCPPEIDLS